MSLQYPQTGRTLCNDIGFACHKRTAATCSTLRRVEPYATSLTLAEIAAFQRPCSTLRQVNPYATSMLRRIDNALISLQSPQTGRTLCNGMGVHDNSFLAAACSTLRRVEPYATALAVAALAALARPCSTLRRVE